MSPHDTVQLSVAICTFNRATVLRDTLDSFAACSAPPFAYELLVVDNRSTDDTAAVVQEFIGRAALPASGSVRYAYEAKQGLSAARNRAIREAAGEVVAFVDDDVYFDAEWMVRINEPFSRDPQVGCVGGRVDPLFELPRPAWLRDAQLWVYGATRYGERDRTISPPEYPIGCNMAVRRSVLHQVGEFNLALGRTGDSLLSNEETEFFDRVHAAGVAVVYAAKAAVQHRVPPGRLTMEWMRRRYVWQGISDAVRDRDGKECRAPLRASIRVLKPLWRWQGGWRGVYWNLSAATTWLEIAYRIGWARQSWRNSWRAATGK